MPKYLALEWDDHEMRLAIASQRGATAVLEKAFAVPLPPAQDQPHTAASLSAVLREALASESVRRLETLAAVGRPSIELKELSLPPAPDDEMPDMVRFQALRDFTQISEATPLDFIPLPGDDTEHRHVLAAAISQELLDEIRSTCEQAGLELKHLVLRPCAAAALLARHQPAPGLVRIFVDLLGDEVDLTVLDSDTPILMRTTRLPGDASLAEYSRPVFLEIRRTIAAAQNRLRGRRVEQVWLCGDGASQQALADMVKNELELTTEIFDPFTAFAQSGGVASRLPAHHSRYAPLLGMLAEAAAGQRHAIDFLEPRRRPAPKSRTRELSLAAVCIGLLACAFVGWTWWRANSLDSEIAGLRTKKSTLDKHIKKNSEVMKHAEALEKWLASDIRWLDELHRLSTKGPKGEDAMLTGLRAEIDNRSGGAKLTMDVLASDSAKVQNQLRTLWPETTRGALKKSDGKIKRYGEEFKAESTIDASADEPTPHAKPGIKPGVKPAVKTNAKTTEPAKKDDKVDAASGKSADAKADKEAAKPDANTAKEASPADKSAEPASKPSDAASEPQTPPESNSKRA